MPETTDSDTLRSANDVEPKKSSLDNQPGDINKETENKSSVTSPTTTANKRAWIQVLGGFLAFLNIWGFPLSYGVFVSFYELEYLHRSAFDIAWIGTVQNSLVSIISVLSGPIYDLGHYRKLVFVGSFLSIFGIFMLSLSTQYYQVFLSHVTNGIGSGLVYVPTLSLIAQGHEKTRSLAMGIVASGIALGGVIYTVVFLKLQPTIGFAWTVRVCGFIALLSYAVGIPCLLGGSGEVKTSGKARKLFTTAAIKDPAWWTYTLAQFMSFWGYLIPMFFIPTYAQVVLGTSQEVGDWLLVGVQGASLVGRLLAGAAAHRLGVMLPLTICLVVSGILNLVWLDVRDVGGLAAYATIYGLFSGSLVALPPSIFPSVCADMRSSGTWMGMAWAMTALAALSGSSIAGTFIDIETATFTGAQIWSGVILLSGAALFGLLWVILARREHKFLL